MSNLDSSFATLLGRQPSDAERQNLYRVRDALGLRDNDALWLILMALQYHQGQYEKIPEAIKQAAIDILRDFKATAEATAKAAAETATADLANAVATVAHKVADDVVVKKKLQWAVGAIVALVVFACVTLVLGYRAGVGAAFKDVTDVQSAATWADSGKGIARRLIWTVPYALGDDGSDLAVVRASDAAWLNSYQGQIGRTLSERAPLGTRNDGSDLTVVRASDAAWLNSADGQQARALSESGTLRWGEWLSAVVDSGLLSEDEPDPSSCQRIIVMGDKWALVRTEDGTVQYCSVWRGRVLFRLY